MKIKKLLTKIILFTFFTLSFIFYSLLDAANTGSYSVKTKIIKGEWEMVENCESRRWEGVTGWGDWMRNTFVEWGDFFGKNCLQVYSTYTSPGGCLVVRTKTFPLENWQYVELVRMDVYVEFPDNTADLKFEPKDKDGNTIESIYYYDLPTGSWIDCEWNIDQSSTPYQNVKQIYLIPDNLGTNPATFYFDNLRLVMTDGTTYYWDVFESSSALWSYSGDGYAYYDNGYQTTESAITWSGSTSTVNSGRIYMQWASDKDGATEAKVESEERDLRGCVKIKAEIKCSRTTAQITIEFYNSSLGWKECSPAKTVSQANTWQTLEWDLPSASDTYWSSVKIIPVIKNTNEVTSGEIYIDNIQVYK
jgi:hypothetical protein